MLPFLRLSASIGEINERRVTNRRGENHSGWDDACVKEKLVGTIIYFQQSRHTQRPKKFSPPDCGTTLYKYTLTGAYNVIYTSVHIRSPRKWTHCRQLVSDRLIASFRLFFAHSFFQEGHLNPLLFACATANRRSRNTWVT